MIESFSFAGYRRTSALFIGAGAVCGLSALAMAKKAVGAVIICDGDTVEPPNLNRQFFQRRDLGRAKATRLARNLRPWAVDTTTFEGINSYVEEIKWRKTCTLPTVVICCPDNDDARAFTSKWCFQRGIPCVIIGLSDDSDYGYVFVQLSKADSSCWGCFQKGRTGKRECGVAANINLPMIISGIVLSACDALVAGHELSWNYRRISLSGKIPDMMKLVPVWEQCPICHDSKLKR